MGDPVTTASGSGEKKALLFSESDIYGNEPPRLLVALGDTPTDDHADVAEVHYQKFSEALEASAAKKKGMGIKQKADKVGGAIADMEVPVASYLTKETGETDKKGKPIRPAPTPEEAMKAILPAIVKKLGEDFSACWKTQSGPAAQWSSGAEERWAQLVNELLFGIDYIGPSGAYNMGSPFLDASGKTVEGEGSGRGEDWLTFIFRRAEAQPVRAKKAWQQTGGGGAGKKGPAYRVYGAFEVVSWKELTYPGWPNLETIAPPGPMPTRPLPEDRVAEHYEVEAENVDLAVPIGAACQHTATLVGLLRGYPLYWMGDVENPGVGYQASEANRAMAIFGARPPRPAKKDGEEQKEAPPSATGPCKLWGPAGSLVPEPEGGEWVEAVPGVLDDPATLQKIKPGTIFVWDPDYRANTKGEKVMMSRYEARFMERQVFSEFFKTRGTVGGSSFGSSWPATAPDRSEHAKKLQERLLKDLKTYRDMARAPKVPKAIKAVLASTRASLGLSGGDDPDAAENQTGPTPVELELDRKRGVERTYKGGHQLPGSHINAILRKHKSENAFQVFDTGVGAHARILVQTGSEAILPFAGGTVADGYRHPPAFAVKADGSATSHEDSGVQVGEGSGKTFAGIGFPPACPRSYEQQVALLEKARSVGLVRLALTRRGGSHWDKKNVLYMSRLRNMYDAEKNYPISKLLWSLRNSPGFTQVQPWWLIYAPLGMLARAMYARDARPVTLDDFVAHYTQPFKDCLAAHAGDAKGKGIPFSEVSEHGIMLRWLQRYGSDSWPPTDEKTIKQRVEQAAAGKLYAGRHYQLLVVVTNHGSDIPAYAGRCQLYTRFKYSEGSTQLVGDGGPLGLGGLKVHDSLSWDESWPNPLPPELSALVPAFFGGTA